MRDQTSAKLVYDVHAQRIDEHATQAGLSKIDTALAHQNDNPIKRLTSGPERKAAKPFEASGKVHELERVEWWEDYDHPSLCVFGHYSLDASVSRQGARAICVDFGAYERRTSSLPYKLTAHR